MADLRYTDDVPAQGECRVCREGNAWVLYALPVLEEGSCSCGLEPSRLVIGTDVTLLREEPGRWRVTRSDGEVLGALTDVPEPALWERWWPPSTQEPLKGPEVDLHRLAGLICRYATSDEALRADAALQDGDLATVLEIGICVVERGDPGMAETMRQMRSALVETLPADLDCREIVGSVMGQLTDAELHEAVLTAIRTSLALDHDPETMLRGPSLPILLERAAERTKGSWYSAVVPALLGYVERKGLTLRALLAELGQLPSQETN